MMLTVPMLALAVVLRTAPPVAAMPANDAGQSEPDRPCDCLMDGVCHAGGEWWSDASKPGCQRFTCLETFDQANSIVHTDIRNYTCGPPPDYFKYMTTPSDDSLPYPGCCPKYTILDPKPIVRPTESSEPYEPDCDCRVNGVCYATGEWWSDASKPGCLRFTCLRVSDRANSIHYIGEIKNYTCDLPPTNSKYLETPGDASLPYPGCCSTYKLLYRLPGVQPPKQETALVPSAMEPMSAWTSTQSPEERHRSGSNAEQTQHLPKEALDPSENEFVRVGSHAF